jgi:hypothetical protein
MSSLDKHDYSIKPYPKVIEKDVFQYGKLACSLYKKALITLIISYDLLQTPVTSYKLL